VADSCIPPFLWPSTCFRPLCCVCDCILHSPHSSHAQADFFTLRGCIFFETSVIVFPAPPLFLCSCSLCTRPLMHCSAPGAQRSSFILDPSSSLFSCRVRLLLHSPHSSHAPAVIFLCYCFPCATSVLTPTQSLPEFHFLAILVIFDCSFRTQTRMRCSAPGAQGSPITVLCALVL